MADAIDVWDDLVAHLTERADDYETFSSYYMGEQSLPVDSAEFRTRFGAFFADFRDNLARPIIEAAEGRVRLQQFGDGEGYAEDAMRVWRRNRMKTESRWVHTEAMVKGDSYVIVLPRPDGKAGIYPQRSESLAIVYDEVDPREKVAAMKWWTYWKTPANGSTEQPYARVNLYFPDRIERYISRVSSAVLEPDFEKYVEYEEEGSYVTRHSVGQVPVFQFAANYDISRGRGRSDLADATKLIDGVNKTVLDMFVASEYTAAPQRWATGVEIPLDPKTGEPMESFKAGADKLWTAPNEDARFGQFAPGALGAYQEAVSTLVDHLAFVTRTPVFALMREVNYPSGESLKSAEGPLRSRVQDHQDDFGQVWLEVMQAALGLDDVDVDEDDLMDIDPDWLPVNAPFSTRELLEEIKIKAEVAGVPEEMLWRELGYSAEDIEEMKEMRNQEATLGQDAFAAAQAEIVAQGIPPADEVADVPGGLTDDIITPTDSAVGAPQ